MQLSDRERPAIDRPALPLPRENERVSHQNDEEMFGRLAREIFYARQRRDQFFAEDLFGEPMWDILLDLYVSKLNGRSISITSACIASGVAPTTALRYIKVMEERGLVRRQEDSADKRRSWISISETAFRSMTQYLADRGQHRLGRTLSIAGPIERRSPRP
jgi:DNA-binding MarR family transcriptional regulator